MEEFLDMSQNDITEALLGSSERVSSTLLNNHVYFLNGEIDGYSVDSAIKWILYENLIEEKDKVLSLYINSPGGSLSDCFALIDIMRQSKYPIKTIGIGMVASAGFFIFACGTKGYRIISRNTSIMFHQYSEFIHGKEHDIDAYYKEFKLVQNRISGVLEEVTGMSKEEVKSKLTPPSDVWLTADELVEYGIADIIV